MHAARFASQTTRYGIWQSMRSWTSSLSTVVVTTLLATQAHADPVPLLPITASPSPAATPTQAPALAPQTVAPPPLTVAPPPLTVAPPPLTVAPPPLTVAPPPFTDAARTWGPPKLEQGQHFTIDPVSDGVLIGGSAAISGLLSLILSTGEIRPTAPGPTSNLLSIDRLAVTQHIDSSAGLYSSIGLGAAIGFAVIDPFLSAYRDGWDAFAVDAVMYAETVALTETLTDLTKIAVRRPRPVDYINCTKNPTSCTDTDLQLSFFSGHASTVGAIGATATYLAFQRGGSKSARAWATLTTSVALTTFVSIERVRSGEHFPTDVMAGSAAGAMIGVLVPHLHRHAQEAPPVWIGYAPVNHGGSITASGTF